MSYKATYRRHTYTSRSGRRRHTPAVPGMAYEDASRSDGAVLVCGVDEVGLGAWAGPVAVGAVILTPGKRLYKVRDSKLLDPARRSYLAERVKEKCLCWSVGVSWPDEIDDVGLSEAVRRAGRRAVGGLECAPDAFLLDGKWNFIGDDTTMIVRGDSQSVSIACASIVAKVTRDSLMRDLSRMFPGYMFDENKGYPSPRHRWALAAVGPSPIHRRFYAPIRKLIDEGVPGRLLTAASASQ